LGFCSTMIWNFTCAATMSALCSFDQSKCVIAPPSILRADNDTNTPLSGVLGKCDSKIKKHASVTPSVSPESTHLLSKDSKSRSHATPVQFSKVRLHTVALICHFVRGFFLTTLITPVEVANSKVFILTNFFAICMLHLLQRLFPNLMFDRKKSFMMFFVSSHFVHVMNMNSVKVPLAKCCFTAVVSILIFDVKSAIIYDEYI
jgi:hypothetical protein